jgi:hypothetical protein
MKLSWDISNQLKNKHFFVRPLFLIFRKKYWKFIRISLKSINIPFFLITKKSSRLSTLFLVDFRIWIILQSWLQSQSKCVGKNSLFHMTKRFEIISWKWIESNSMWRLKLHWLESKYQMANSFFNKAQNSALIRIWMVIHL